MMVPWRQSTASLHFTKRLLSRLEKKGIKIINVTLHVSAGTFLPIRQKNINKHKMHFEYGYISKSHLHKSTVLKKMVGKLLPSERPFLEFLSHQKIQMDLFYLLRVKQIFL